MAWTTKSDTSAVAWAPPFPGDTGRGGAAPRCRVLTSGMSRNDRYGKALAGSRRGGSLRSRCRKQIRMEDALDQELVRSADCHSLAVLRELRSIRDPSRVLLKSANARAAITDFLRT